MRHFHRYIRHAARLDPTTLFDTLLYTGDGTAIGSGGQSVTGLTFTPDLVMIKGRSLGDGTQVYDSVRGPQALLEWPTTNDELSVAEGLDSFDGGGFTVGSDGGVNTNTSTYVAWCWLAGGAPSSNTDGSITTSVSANLTAGFSVISWTGTGANATIGHGLTEAPEFVIVRNRSDAVGSRLYHAGAAADPETDYFSIHANSAIIDDATAWNDTAPTSSVISVGASNNSNGSGDAMIAYAWHSVTNFSKFGSYTGNGTGTGPEVDLGFTPGLVVIKRADSAAGFLCYDNKRDVSNPNDAYLIWNATNSEGSGANEINFNGSSFQAATSDATVNASGGTYCYMAWAG